MLCSCCGEQRKEIHVRNSKLLKSMKIYLCNICETEKREPRFIIILAGRREGIEVVSDYLKRRRYLGDEITAKEFV